MTIKKANPSDLRAILDLQYLAYQSEAKLLNDYTIPPLLQTHDELVREYNKGIILKAADESGEIIGSVRAYRDGGTAYIGRLIVHPAMQGKGIGTKLLSAIEQEYPKARYELYTSSKSIRNIALYERLGYVRFREQQISGQLTMVYLEKNHLYTQMAGNPAYKLQPNRKE